jgi:hypothetical protein
MPILGLLYPIWRLVLEASEKSGQAIWKSFCPGATSLARHVTQRLCSSLGSLPRDKIPFHLSHPNFRIASSNRSD